MDLQTAPFFTDVSPGPSDGAAWWVTARDGVRLRVAAWGRDASEGTVLLFPGRTEYVEKYALTAQDFYDRGLATLAIDWRGQGLADRALPDRRVGHVSAFDDFQQDVAAMIRMAQNLALPKPWYVVAHSMGGCIGLRALMNGLDVQAAAFTGPMWGIKLKPHLVIPAWILSHVMPLIGRGGDIPLGLTRDPYVLDSPFEDNMLTRDPEMFEMMRDQLLAHPDLALGAPSYLWLREALHETIKLSRLPSPNVACLTFVGSNERIVRTNQIDRRMARWPNSQLEIVQDGEHEVLMEGPKLRGSIVDQMVAHFKAPRSS